jgi:hypothetical protein
LPEIDHAENLPFADPGKPAEGISGAKGRDQRPAFDQMLKDAVRRRYDISDGMVH